MVSQGGETQGCFEKLRGLFTLDPWFSREVAFPSGWVGHSRTIWAVTSVVKFLREFEGLADLPDQDRPSHLQVFQISFSAVAPGGGGSSDLSFPAHMREPDGQRLSSRT